MTRKEWSKEYQKAVTEGDRIRQLAVLIARGVSAGESIPELQERVQHVFEVANTRVEENRNLGT